MSPVVENRFRLSCRSVIQTSNGGISSDLFLLSLWFRDRIVSLLESIVDLITFRLITPKNVPSKFSIPSFICCIFGTGIWYNHKKLRQYFYYDDDEILLLC